MKKWISIILSAAMFLSMLPTQFAKAGEEASYFCQIIITGVEVRNFTPPEAGQHPDFDVTCEDEGYYRTVGDNPVTWTDSTDNRQMTSTDYFEAGHTYFFSLNVRASGDYKYLEDGTAWFYNEDGMNLQSWVTGQVTCTMTKAEKKPAVISAPLALYTRSSLCPVRSSPRHL